MSRDYDQVPRRGTNNLRRESTGLYPTDAAVAAAGLSYLRIGRLALVWVQVINSDQFYLNLE